MWFKGPSGSRMEMEICDLKSTETGAWVTYYGPNQDVVVFTKPVGQIRLNKPVQQVGSPAWPEENMRVGRYILDE
jgi:hypothetical protein